MHEGQVDCGRLEIHENLTLNLDYLLTCWSWGIIVNTSLFRIKFYMSSFFQFWNLKKFFLIWHPLVLICRAFLLFFIEKHKNVFRFIYCGFCCVLVFKQIKPKTTKRTSEEPSPSHGETSHTLCFASVTLYCVNLI